MIVPVAVAQQKSKRLYWWKKTTVLAFALDLMLKDIRLAQQAGAEYPLLKTLLDTYGKAHDQGLGQLDVIGIIESIKS